MHRRCRSLLLLSGAGTRSDVSRWIPSVSEEVLHDSGCLNTRVKKLVSEHSLWHWVLRPNALENLLSFQLSQNFTDVRGSMCRNDRFWRPYKAPSPGIFSGGVYGNLKSLKTRSFENVTSQRIECPVWRPSYGTARQSPWGTPLSGRRSGKPRDRSWLQVPRLIA